ncbi:hypothetical protein ACLOJK_007252 [Asimina triloba]
MQFNRTTTFTKALNRISAHQCSLARKLLLDDRDLEHLGCILPLLEHLIMASSLAATLLSLEWAALPFDLHNHLSNLTEQGFDLLRDLPYVRGTPYGFTEYTGVVIAEGILQGWLSYNKKLRKWEKGLIRRDKISLKKRKYLKFGEL